MTCIMTEQTMSQFLFNLPESQFKSILSLSNSLHIRWNKIFSTAYLLYLQFSYTDYFFAHYLLSCTVELV